MLKPTWPCIRRNLPQLNNRDLDEHASRSVKPRSAFLLTRGRPIPLEQNTNSLEPDPEGNLEFQGLQQRYMDFIVMAILICILAGGALGGVYFADSGPTQLSEELLLYQYGYPCYNVLWRLYLVAHPCTPLIVRGGSCVQSLIDMASQRYSSARDGRMRISHTRWQDCLLWRVMNQVEIWKRELISKGVEEQFTNPSLR